MSNIDPFSEEFSKNIQPQGISSADVQRKIFISEERIKYLFEKISKLEDEVVKLKTMKIQAGTKKATSK